MKNKIDVNLHCCKVFKENRIRCGLSQDQIASILDLTRTSIVNIEAGRQNLSVDKLWICCCLFKLDPGKFLPPIKPLEIKFQTEVVTITKDKLTASIKFI